MAYRLKQCLKSLISMAYRLKQCLNSLISDKQSAFIEGRMLTDNVLVAFEVNHHMKKKTQEKNGIAGLKIDISKAYDKLEWSFIESMMHRFGFSSTWITRIVGYFRSVVYLFIHDENVFGEVHP